MKRFAIALLILSLISFICFSVTLSWDEKEYYRRWFVYKNSDILDYKNVFPNANFSKSDKPYFFEENKDEAIDNTRIELDSKSQPLLSILENSNTTAFLILKDDKLVYEFYGSGYNRESINTSFSIAKSITGLLIGIAVDGGYIKSIDDPITNYLPELLDEDPQLATVSIRDLLNMRSGFAYADHDLPWGDKPRAYYHPNVRRVALEQKLAFEPGTTFQYNNYNPIVLGLILEKATGKSVPEFYDQVLWGKLGMEFDGSWNLDSDLPETRMAKMESGINARAIDFAKFGYLMLKKGEWGSKIIPKDWYEISTNPDPSLKLPDDYGPEKYYQYGWWVSGPTGDRNYTIAALGHLGQYIYVFPDQNMVIVRFGKNEGKVEWEKLFQKLSNYTFFE